MTERDVLQLNPKEFKGGVELWGVLPPFYDSSKKGVKTGIHVHAWDKSGGDKKIDRTFKEVEILFDIDNKEKRIDINYEDAVDYFAKKILDSNLNFGNTIHSEHSCVNCAHLVENTRNVQDNPIFLVQELLDAHVNPEDILEDQQSVSIDHSKYKRGITLWGSSPAILRTSPKELSEKAGIHLHAYNDEGERDIDGTFGTVIINNEKIDNTSSQHYMAQTAIPSLKAYLEGLKCNGCNASHFDNGPRGSHAHTSHNCENCGIIFESKPSISNPVFSVINFLEANRH